MTAGDSAMLRRCTATISRVGTGSCAARATSSVAERLAGRAAGPGRCRARRRPGPGGTGTPCDWWAIRGRRPVPSYIRVSHWRQIVPSGVAIQSSSTRSRGLTRARPASRWPAWTMTSATSRARGVVARWSGMASGTSPQLCTTPRSTWPEATRSTVSHGSRSERVRVRSGCAVAQVAQGGRHEAAHRRRERRQPQVAGHRPGLAVQPGLDLLEVGEQPAALVDEVATVAGEHHAAADPLEEGYAGLPLEPLHLLRDGAGRVAQRLGGGDHGAVAVDGAERGQGGQVDHEAMLHAKGA